MSTKFWALIWLVLVAVFWLSWIVVKADAHDWFIGQKNPVGMSCCYGESHASRDCKNAVADHNVMETKDGYIITLTRVEMLNIYPNLENSSEFKKVAHGIREFIPHKDSQPGLDGSYSICLSWQPIAWRPGEKLKWVRCFFYPSNS